MRFRFALSLGCRAPRARRFSSWLSFALSALGLLGCAKEHSARELIAHAVEAGSSDARWDEEDSGKLFPTIGPIDAGPHRLGDAGLDAGRMSFPFDARVPGFADGGFRGIDASLRDASLALDAGDTGLPAWQTPDSATVAVSVTAVCDPPPAAPVPDAGCRPSGFHAPPCYKAPANCPALSESSHCTGFGASGELLLLGLDRGTSCSIQQDSRYAVGAGSNAFAQIGADIFSISDDVILKRSITDGSFDVAPVQAWTIFAMGDALVIEALDGGIRRYATWEALKSGAPGELLATATAGAKPAFGANRSTIAAVWPGGSLYLLTVGDARQRTLQLQGFERNDSSPIHGIDLAEDGRLFVSTDAGVSIYSTQDGHLLSRLRAPTLFGLSCQAGLSPGTAPPVLSASPRPGYYAPDRSDYIVTSSDCRGPFNGPRYLGEKAGPELIVIGNFFTDANTVRDERTTPHVLVLTTVEATQWNVVVAAGANVERIIVNGSASPIMLQSATPVPIETYFDTRSLGIHPGEWPALEESRFRAALETLTSRNVTETFGCHFGSTYLVRDVPPLCPSP